MFELALPWVLLALPLPFVTWFLLPQAKSQLPTALKIPFYQALVNKINTGKRSGTGKGELIFLALSWCCLVFALSGPRWVGELQPLARDGRNLMLVLDLSGSMDLTDMSLNGQPATRLAVVKQTAEQFVRARVGDRIGLILFGARAYLQTPLTYDHQAVLLRLEDATVGLAGQTTSIGDALGLAVKRLQAVPAQGRTIILLTDGANNSGVLAPLKAAELASLDKIKVYTIGLGSEPDPTAANSMLFNMNASADLDEDTLEKIAELTQGRYFRATDIQSLQAIYATINQLETVKQDEAKIRPQKEYYSWPLGLALLMLMVWLFDKSRFSRFFSREGSL